jgi:hypothetical protein
LTVEVENEDSESDEAWIMGAHADAAIRVRNLHLYLKRGGALKEVRLVESEDGAWTVWVRLASRAGEYRLNVYKSDQPKIYRDVGLAVAACREDFGYFGPLILSTERAPRGAGQSAKDADSDSDAN